MAGGRPSMYSTSYERRQAKLASQRRWKEKKRLGNQKHELTNRDSTCPPLTHHSDEVTAAGPASESIAPPPSTCPTNTYFPGLLPEQVSEHIDIVYDKLSTLETKLLGLHSGLSEPEWAVVQVNLTERAVMENQHEERIAELKECSNNFSELEKFAEECYAVVGDLDPGLKHPLSHRFSVITAAVKRSRRILREMRQTLMKGSFTDMYAERSLIVHRVWGENVTVRGSELSTEGKR